MSTVIEFRRIFRALDILLLLVFQFLYWAVRWIGSAAEQALTERHSVGTEYQWLRGLWQGFSMQMCWRAHAESAPSVGIGLGILKFFVSQTHGKS